MFSSAIIDFWISTLLVSFIPGPAMLYVAGQTLANGPSAGWQAALGMHLGRYVHIIWAVTSISLVLAMMPEVYVIIRLTGALYLLWLGFSVIMHVESAHSTGLGALDSTARRSLMQSAWVEILNPQTAVYFVTQLPRFVDPHGSNPSLKLVLLGLLVNVTGTLGDLASMACARFLRIGLSENNGMIRKMQLGGGSLIVGLGMHVLLPDS